MKETVNVEIFIIGNEILTGEIQDTNTHWLCREITTLGGKVARGTVLRDDLGVIAAELRAAMDRGTRIIFTSGGLGPTADDLTLAAVAESTGRKLQLNEKARDMIRESYDALFAKGNPGPGRPDAGKGENGLAAGGCGPALQHRRHGSLLHA